MKLNTINFEKSNGGIGRTASGEDHVSALMFYGLSLTFGSATGNIKGFDTIDTSGSSSSVTTTYAKRITYLEQLTSCGFTYTKSSTNATGATAANNVVWYHVSEFFRMNPNGEVYLFFKTGTSATAYVAKDLSVLQNYANGSIRQVGIFSQAMAAPATVQSDLVALEKEHKPMSCVLTYSGKSVVTSTLTGTTLSRVKGQSNVSVLIGCDFTPQLALDLGDFAYYGCIGACMGAISKASVHECIAWVQKFPLGFTHPAIFNGNLIKNIPSGDQELLNNKYIFVRTYVGDPDCYFNDSHTLDVETSDYCYIENVRTIDKACRGVYTSLLPYISSPLQVDASTGKLSPDTIAYLETIAGKPLEQMEKAGELSGYRVEIDPAQNVLATSSVDVVIKQVGVGVMRTVNVKIGFTTKL